ncbi:LysR family transcriptional regulator [Photobacterium sp. OFAV2-7]|uniref:LysR family transcriptional regulator n=1 Tax=Photobacterium sp. OFAV2-7 TaxID=2917748 RepID=UPI001EF6CE73|nr:LysR family transcriptional regulator [Photobacterium sp. OFAV2-7]MCG7584310.1 LysR family transcriptional regulator [Photobacterium sp. OFAV2-7]
MNYDVTFLEIKLFLQTIQFGNFSEVARRNDMTPSSVSRKMSQLEDKVGTKLFHRHTRAISLTEEGSAFAKYGREIMAQFEQVTEQIEQKADTPRGVVRISAPVAFGRLHVAPYLSEFLSKYPRVNIELIQSDDYLDPAKEGIDLLIRIGVMQDSNLRIKRFGKQSYVMAASPTYLKVFGTPKSPEELLHHNCLVFKGTNGLQRWFIGKNGSKRPYDVKGNLYSNNADTLVEGALNGSGIVLFPTWLIGKHLRDGTLESVLSQFESSTTLDVQEIAALYLDTDKLAPKVRAVIDFYSGKFGSPCYWDTES